MEGNLCDLKHLPILFHFVSSLFISFGLFYIFSGSSSSFCLTFKCFKWTGPAISRHMETIVRTGTQ